MLRHQFSIGDHAPTIINAVVEIPKTEAMTQKLEVDLGSGKVIAAREVDPPLEIHWHYGCVPETIGDEGEALDVLVFEPMPQNRKTGDVVAVRPLGILKTHDDWEIRDDKIIALPSGQIWEHIQQIDDLPLIQRGARSRCSAKDAIETFFRSYKRLAPLALTGWGNAAAAKNAISEGQKRYSSIPSPLSVETTHAYQQFQHVFVPPPPKHFGPTRYVEDIQTVRQLFEQQNPHPEYGQIVSGQSLKEAIRSAGHNISRSRLIGHDRECLINERLRIAELLKKYGAKVFTASNDRVWLKQASNSGIVASFVDHESYEVENVAGLSAQDLKTIQFQRADGTKVVIAEAGVDEHAILDRLLKIGIDIENERCLVLNAPDRMIPWEVPARGPIRMTQLTNWIDYGFNIWPDRNNLPHLVIGEALEHIAAFQGRHAALGDFIAQSKEVFEGVHILQLSDGAPFGSPTNSIDVGTAIISNTSLSARSRDAMQERLGRPIDNSLLVNEDAPGLRCAVVPVDKVTYAMLLEGDPLYHASINRREVDPLDPMDAFFDLHGSAHQSLVARVQAKREAHKELDPHHRPRGPALHQSSGEKDN
ncbi:inorganic diphosphatase [Pseudosulfitobacter sp. SM2401]|uniref:inorganic diphosphatase n=1 Tax=Pseudosulfitobacter sp. SM2401 TaxID=3350098 RepID=UPI0036F32EEC